MAAEKKNIFERLHEEYEDNKKVLTETPVEARLDKNWHLRMYGAKMELYDHYPDNPKRHRMLGLLEELAKLSTECLEHKE